MKCGKNFRRFQGCFIDPSHCWLISIGDDVTFSTRVTVLAHDACTKKATGYARIGKVEIGNGVFVGSNVTILPNVKIGDGAIIGAGSVVTHDIPAGAVAVGNPARVIYSAEQWDEKISDQLNSSVKFSEDYTERKHISDDKKTEMIKALSKGIGFVE